MGDVVAFKPCRWSDNGLCLAHGIESCVCYRGASSRILTTLGRARGTLPPLLAEGRDAGNIVDYRDLPTPTWAAPLAPSAADIAKTQDLIAFARSGAPPEYPELVS